MINYSNLCNEQDLLKIKTHDDETKMIKYSFEKHNHENVLKSLNLYIEHYKKK